jgi:long-chain fatty acid transport protein
MLSYTECHGFPTYRGTSLLGQWQSCVSNCESVTSEMLMIKPVARVMGSVFLMVCISQVALGNGYKILCVKSGKATAMGEAFIVQADDPSAIAYNPAGIVQLKGNQVNLHATICNAYAEHTAPSGETTENEDRWQVVPSLFVTSDFGRDDITAGLGVSFPNGLSSEWAQDSLARYVATYSDLVVADISPALAVRVNDKLSVGAAVNYYYSDARLESMVDAGMEVGMPGAMDVERKLEGSGSAWGFNVGSIYRFNRRHRIGGVYRHGFSIDYDGDLTAAGMENGISAAIDFPASVVVGYAFDPTDKWTIEFNADWTDWASVDDITIDFDTPGVPSAGQAQDLENTLAYKLGVQYRYTDDLSLRWGYIYNENATSEETWRPSLVDTDIHFVTAGLGWEVNDLTIDTALQFVFYEDRTVDNNVDFNEMVSSSSIDGTYETFGLCFSLAATRRF